MSNEDTAAVPAALGPDKAGKRARQVRIAKRIYIGMGIFVAFIVGLSVGVSGNEPASAGVAAPAPAVTVTAAPAPAVTVTAAPVTAPPVTVTAPAPAPVTITAEPTGPAAAIEGDGTFMVGTEIQPGRYRTDGGDGCYWARLSGTSGELNDIIANDNVDGPTTVTIKKSDVAFHTDDCGTWSAA